MWLARALCHGVFFFLRPSAGPTRVCEEILFGIRENKWIHAEDISVWQAPGCPISIRLVHVGVQRLMRETKKVTRVTLVRLCINTELLTKRAAKPCISRAYDCVQRVIWDGRVFRDVLLCWLSWIAHPRPGHPGIYTWQGKVTPPVLSTKSPREEPSEPDLPQIPLPIKHQQGQLA